MRKTILALPLAGICVAAALISGIDAISAEPPPPPPPPIDDEGERADIPVQVSGAFGFPSRDVPEIPAELIDRAYLRYLDPLALGRAWRHLDSSAMTDAALQLMDGERVLLRPHRGLDTKDVLKLAARLAEEKRDAASLDRLEKAARASDTNLADEIAGRKKLASAERSVAAGGTIFVDDTSVEDFSKMKGVYNAALRARLSGDSRYIVPETDDVEPNGDLLAGLPPKQREMMEKILSTTRGALPEKPHINESSIDSINKLASLDLDKLAAGVRDWNPAKTIHKLGGGDIPGALTGADFRLPNPFNDGGTRFTDMRDYGHWATIRLVNTSGWNVVIRYSGGRASGVLANNREYANLEIHSAGRGAQGRTWLQIRQPDGSWGTRWNVYGGGDYYVTHVNGPEALVLRH